MAEICIIRRILRWESWKKEPSLTETFLPHAEHFHWNIDYNCSTERRHFLLMRLTTNPSALSLSLISTICWFGGPQPAGHCFEFEISCILANHFNCPSLSVGNKSITSSGFLTTKRVSSIAPATGPSFTGSSIVWRGRPVIADSTYTTVYLSNRVLENMSIFVHGKIRCNSPKYLVYIATYVVHYNEAWCTYTVRVCLYSWVSRGLTSDAGCLAQTQPTPTLCIGTYTRK